MDYKMCTAQHNTLQRNTTLTHGLQDMYSTTQYTTTQHNATQRNTMLTHGLKDKPQLTQNTTTQHNTDTWTTRYTPINTIHYNATQR